MTKYGRSLWLDRFPSARVPAYPKYRGASKIDVVIVGGGLTGCAAAYAFAAAGEKVLLLEAERLGCGQTAYATGWISPEPGVPFGRLDTAIGRRSARLGWQAWRRSALDFAALLRRLDIKCALEPHGLVTIARTSEETVRLKREFKARRDAGVDASLLNARAVRADLAVDGSAGVRTREGATIDPYRACLGLAAAARERGAKLFERSPVRGITFNRKTADVHALGGTIRTTRVVIATAMPTATLFRALARHFWFRSTYYALTMAVPAKIRHQLGRRDEVVRDLADPPHLVRWMDDDRLLVSGGDAASVPMRQRDKAVVQRTGQLMYELSTMYPDISGIQPEYGWTSQYALTAEGLPYIGSHRNYPHHLFVFGDSSHSVTGAYLASRIVLRQHMGEHDPADEAFSFNRA